MKIKLFPFLTTDTVALSVNGDVLNINGSNVDFTDLPEGYQILGTLCGNDWLTSDYVQRIDGEINLTIKYPVSFDSPEEVRVPKEPIVLVVKKGKVPLPDSTPLTKEEDNLEDRP